MYRTTFVKSEMPEPVILIAAVNRWGFLRRRFASRQEAYG